MNGFEQVIKTYLDNRAKEDELFAKSYAKESKSIEECCRYIIQEVRKTNRQGFADDEIYGMAVHYYDEDNIKVEGATPQCKVVTNQKTDKKFENPKPKVQPQQAKAKKEEQKSVDLFNQPQQSNPKPKAKSITKKEQALQGQLSLF